MTQETHDGGAAREATSTPARRALACALYVAGTAFALGACDGPFPATDGGPPSDGASDAAPGGARVDLSLEVSGEAPPDEWELTEAFVALATLRADNDRGGELEPTWDGIGRVRLDEDGPRMMVAAVPANYGGVSVVSTSGGTTFELRYRGGEDAVEVVSTRPYEIMARCREGVIGLRPDQVAQLRVVLDTSFLAERLAEAELPEPVDGTIRVDAASVEGLEDAFDAAWYVECEHE
jgi:hypothetical protein